MGDGRYDLRKQLGSVLPTSGEWWGKKIDWLITAIMFTCVFLAGVAIKNTFFDKPKPQQVESIGTINGAVAKSDSHNTTTVVHNHFPLSDIFSNILSFGAKNKVEK